MHLVGNSFGGSLTLRALANPALRERIASVTTITGTGGPGGADMAKIGDFDGTPGRLEEIVGYLCEPFDTKDAQLEARMRMGSRTRDISRPWGPAHRGTRGHGKSSARRTLPGNLRASRPRPADRGQGTTRCSKADGARSCRNSCPAQGRSPADSKHSPNITQPQQTWDLISGFLTEITKGGNA